MNGPLRLAYRNRVDTSALSASSSSGGLTAGKLASQDIQEVWRSGSTTAWILANLGASMEIGVVALINSNATAGDVKRIRLSNADSSGASGEVYDSDSLAADVDPNDRKMVTFIEPGVAGQYVRIDLSQSSPPSAGRLVISPVWTPTHDRAEGAEPIWRDWSIETLTRGLNPIRDRRARQRGETFVLRGLTESEINNEVRIINRDIGTSDDMLVCIDVDNPATTTIWGPMETMIRAPRPGRNFWFAEFTIWDRL